MPRNANTGGKELDTLKALFEKLRAGKVIEAQKKLLECNQSELYEWVSGGAPAFDNSSFSESDDFGDFIPNELGSSSLIHTSC